MNENNIILTASGYNDINNFVSEEMKELFCEISENKKVMILANAAPEGTGNYKARGNVRDNFLKSGASYVDTVDITDENMEKMLDYDLIYGLGGDPTYLIELNRNPKFKETLVKFLKKGIYIGESAGSMILCDDLKCYYTLKKGTKPKYDIELDTYKGLGLTNHKIFPHWNKVTEDVKAKTKDYEQETGEHFTKLNDGEFIQEKYIQKDEQGQSI